MRRTAFSAAMGAAMIAAAMLAAAVLSAGAEGAVSQQPAAAKPTTQTSSSWKVGIAQFAIPEGDGAPAILATALPRLIVGDLRALPQRRTPPDEAKEAAERKRAQARFAAGAELAAKLDDRAQGYLTPNTEGAEKSFGLYTADKAVRDSSRKLGEKLKDEGSSGMDAEEPKADLAVALWEGHAAGKLIDTPDDDLPKAAKTASVDFLVSGTVYKVGAGYAAVVVKGYDAALGRQVLSEKAYFAFDDPEPVARQMAELLERWFAGRDFARLEIKSEPVGAEIYVNGKALSGSSRVAYVYEPGLVHVSASAPGFEPGSQEFLVALGEDREVDVRLDASSKGSVSVTTDPAGASLSLDSLPAGGSPLVIPLDGSRKILYVAADGMEPETVVLPAAGESKLDLQLRPITGIGPAERIAAAKDAFYWSFGWFVLSVPITSLTISCYNGYDEAYQRSGSPSMEYARWNASIAVGAAVAITATTAAFMIVRLVKYLKTVR